jgi:TPR repeat protein
MLTILVIVLNALLAIFWLAIAVAVPIAILFAIPLLLNTLAALSYRKGKPLKFKKLTIAGNIFLGLLAVILFFREEPNIEFFGFFILSIMLCSLWLIKQSKTVRQETSDTDKDHEPDTDISVEYQLPSKYQPDAFAGEIKKAGFLGDVFIISGMMAVFIAILILSDEIKDKALMEVGVLPFLWLGSGMIGLALWHYFSKQQKNMKYAQRLVMLGTDKDTAKIKAAQDMPADQRIEEEYLWSQFIADNRQEIEQLDRDIKTILQEKYQIDTSVVPPIHERKEYSPALYYLSCISAAQAAEQIYGVVCLYDNGMDSWVADSVGVKAPSADTQRVIRQSSSPTASIITYGSLALIMYGMASIFIGPSAEIFVPSVPWYKFGIVSALGLIALVFYQTYQANRTSEAPRKRPKIKPLHLFAAIPLLIWGAVYFALIYGVGEIFTEAFGATERKVITVQKDKDTEKSYGGQIRRSATAYCVTADEFPWFAESFCIEKAHYQILPEENISFSFLVKASALGYVIKGYRFFEGVPESGVSPGDMDFLVAEGYFKDGQLEGGYKYLEIAANKGHVEAQYFTALKYLNDKPPDYKAARDRLMQAVDQGHDKAPFELGLMYKKGHGTAPDQVQAAKWFRVSAERGYPKAQFIYASHLMMGYGVEKDLIEMVAWFRKAAENNEPDAQYVLGMFHIKKEAGVKQDGPEALKWLSQAAQQGHWDAQYALGILYGRGDLISVDLIESYAWLSAASVKENKKIDKMLANIESLLSAEMLTKARKRAALYKQDYRINNE